MRYFVEEMRIGNALRSTTILGNEKERERVYDTIFRLPWRCELVNFAFFFLLPIKSNLCMYTVLCQVIILNGPLEENEHTTSCVVSKGDIQHPQPLSFWSINFFYLITLRTLG